MYGEGHGLQTNKGISDSALMPPPNIVSRRGSSSGGSTGHLFAGPKPSGTRADIEKRRTYPTGYSKEHATWKATKDFMASRAFAGSLKVFVTIKIDVEGRPRDKRTAVFLGVSSSYLTRKCSI